MYPFVESLRIENGQICHLRYHNERMNRTRREVLGCIDLIDLRGYIHPGQYREITKCRVEYRENVLKVEFDPYRLREIRTLKPVTCDSVCYHYKSTNRDCLNKLFALREECDDILIIKNGLLTDTFAANVALYNGKEWHTPTTPLLPGTTRARLLDQGTIKEQDIPLTALSNYQTIRIFNAMINFGRIELPVSAIKF
ncbi:MAG: aminotransferase class IV family protein [Tannerellaceae bacterium]|nr:aminotransferase class IV family protein [Tannerellaceae bacterium]